MPRNVTFNGVTHQFPDDATDAEISNALNAMGQTSQTTPQPQAVAPTQAPAAAAAQPTQPDTGSAFSGPSLVSNLLNSQIGAGRSIAGMTANLMKLAQRVPDLAKIINPATIQNLQGVSQPDNPVQRRAGYATQATTGIIASMVAAGLAPEAIAARIAAQGAAGGVQGALNTGTPSGMATGAVIGAGTQGLTEAAPAVARGLVGRAFPSDFGTPETSSAYDPDVVAQKAKETAQIILNKTKGGSLKGVTDQLRTAQGDLPTRYGSQPLEDARNAVMEARSRLNASTAAQSPADALKSVLATTVRHTIAPGVGYATGHPLLGLGMEAAQLGAQGAKKVVTDPRTALMLARTANSRMTPAALNAIRQLLLVQQASPASPQQ